MPVFLVERKQTTFVFCEGSLYNCFCFRRKPASKQMMHNPKTTNPKKFTLSLAPGFPLSAVFYFTTGPVPLPLPCFTLPLARFLFLRRLGTSVRAASLAFLSAVSFFFQNKKHRKKRMAFTGCKCYFIKIIKWHPMQKRQGFFKLPSLYRTLPFGNIANER